MDPLGFSLNLAPAPAVSPATGVIIGGGRSIAAGPAAFGGLTGRPGAGFASFAAVPPAAGPAAGIVEVATPGDGAAPIAGKTNLLGSTNGAPMRGFAGCGSGTPAGAAGGGETAGGGAFSGGFPSFDCSGSDGLIAMRGLSFNNGGFAAGIPATEGAEGGATGATGGGDVAGAGDSGTTGGAASGDLSRRSFSFTRGSGSDEDSSLMQRQA
jgi:hypothetical protein